ncbi:hypothetical protein EDB80DRAFT_410145 [Ilyonectria destructans]|nr:hypothetical protein EDB80DRAFT_410145 [Ilyonectria destructans]
MGITYYLTVRASYTLILALVRTLHSVIQILAQRRSPNFSKSKAQERSPSSLSQSYRSQSAFGVAPHVLAHAARPSFIRISSMSCGHTEWTRVRRQDKDRLLVRQSGRLKALVSQLPHTCRPLRQQRGTRKRSAAAACGTVHPSPPMLFHHERNVISLEPHLARANAHIQILFPYIDVICFPCSSRQCLALLMQQFAAWRSALSTRDRSRLAPELLVILIGHKVSEEEVRRVLEGSSGSWLLWPSALTTI